MKIGFDAKRLFTNLSGLGNYSRTLVRSLAEFYPEEEYNLYTPRTRKNEQTTEFLERDSYNTHHYTGRFGSLWRSFSIKDQLKKDSISVYHGLSNELPFGIRKTRSRAVLTIHDLIFKVLPETYPPLDRRIYDFKVKHSLNNADIIVAISQNTKNDIIRYYGIAPEKIEVIHQSCDPLFYEDDAIEFEPIREQYSLPENYLLCVGSIKKRKNLLTLIEAHKKVDRDVRIPLVIIGEARESKEVTEIERAIGKDSQVLWIKDLWNNRHLKAVYTNARAFIYPSLYEGFGLPVVEAMLCGTPVITSNTSSLPEAGGPTTLYVDPANASAISSAIERLLTETELQEQMSRDGKVYALENFSRKRSAHRMMDLYHRVL